MRRAALLVALAACAPGTPETTPWRFTDVTAASGVDMVVTSGASPAEQILDVKGGGLALIDRDGDGDWDLFVPNGATPESPERGPGCRLFDNDGALRFTDVTAAAGLEFSRWGMGVAVGDADGDGHDDLAVACYGENALLANRGDGTFEETTARAGVGDRRWSAACAFGDLDGDGDLDLYVANYLRFDRDDPPPASTFRGMPVFGGPFGMTGEPDTLYRNDGDGTFTDVSESAGVRAVEPSFGLGVVVLDLDLDGRQEVFVGNDSMPNFLFDGPPGALRLEDRAVAAGVASNQEGGNQATMGIAVGDVDGNGYPDLFTTNFSDDTNTLHAGVDGRFFDDRTSRYGLGIVSRPYLGWAAMFYDLDHDADEDLLVFNGHVYPHATVETMGAARDQAPLLFERVGPRFERVEPEGALAEPHCDRSAVFGDLDRDGDVDVVVGELAGPLRVLRNDAADGPWLSVSLRDTRPGAMNPRGLGARVVVRQGGHRQTRWIFSGGSYQSACSTDAHFGLRPDAAITTVEVTWPDGETQLVPGPEPNVRLVVTRD